MFRAGGNFASLPLLSLLRTHARNRTPRLSVRLGGSVKITRRLQFSGVRLLFWGFAVLCFGLYLFDRSPVALQATEATVSGAMQARAGLGDVLVVLDAEEMVRSSAAGRFERSWSWVDAIEQEVGPVRTAQTSELSAKMLESTAFVIVTQSSNATEQMQRHLGLLEGFVSRGGTLLLELPQGALRATFAADGEGGWRSPRAITAVDRVTPDVAVPLLKMPLFTRFVGSTRPPKDAVSFIAMDGSPVVYATRRGDGAVVVVDFDFGSQVSALQQGLPTSEGRLEPRVPGDALHTSDLIAAPSLATATAPYADLLEAYVLHVAMGFASPMVALWPFPAGAPGALLSSHDAVSYAGRPLWMSTHEKTLDARTTTFLASSSYPEAAHAAVAVDEDVAGQSAMLWITSPAHAAAHKRFGFFGVEPVQERLSFADQLRSVKAIVGEKYAIRGARTEGGSWMRDPFAPYRVMAAQQMRYSVSYEPLPSTGIGFGFGTCQPFTPVDNNGLPFPLLEVPVCAANPSGPNAKADLTKMVQDAAKGGWAVHVLTGADRFEQAPNMAWFEAWQAALDEARRQRVWIGGAGEFMAFRKQRGETTLRTSQRKVMARTAAGQPTDISFVFEAQTKRAGLAAVFPRRLDGLRLVEARRAASLDGQGERISTDVKELNQIGREAAMIPLQEGFTTLSVRYKK